MTFEQQLTTLIMAFISVIVLCMSGCKYNPEVRYEFEDKEGAKEYVEKLYKQKVIDYNSEESRYCANESELNSFWEDSTEKAREFYTVKEILIDDRSLEVEAKKVFMRKAVLYMWIFFWGYVILRPITDAYVRYQGEKRQLHLKQLLTNIQVSERLADPNYNPIDK
jgi:hypothetical protein